MNRARNFPPSPAFSDMAADLAKRIADLECSDGSDEVNDPLNEAFSATEQALIREPVSNIGDLLLKVELLARIGEDTVINPEEWRALARDVRSLNGPGMTFHPEAWLQRWKHKGGGYVRTDSGLSFVAPQPPTLQQRLLLDELQRAQGQRAVADCIDGNCEPAPVGWATLRDAFTQAAGELPDEAKDDELNAYWEAWNAAMLAEADDSDAIRWKIAQLVTKTAEVGEFTDHDELLDAIMADVERLTRKGGAA